MFQHTAARRRLAPTLSPVCTRGWRFNTQPPEGGWALHAKRKTSNCRFNTQPPEGGWQDRRVFSCVLGSFNTQPPEGGWLDCSDVAALKNRFQHTAARRRLDSGAMDSPILARFQHTAARRRLGAGLPIDGTEQWFQHTAARRRLVQVVSPHDDVGSVSTHSRPKAAGFGVESTQPPTISFNTQPPEGGWQ